MTSKPPLTLPQIQQDLEDMFRFTSGLALGHGKYSEFDEGTRVAAAEASAHLAGMLMGVHELEMILGIPPDPDGSDGDPDGVGSDEGDLEGTGPSDDWGD